MSIALQLFGFGGCELSIIPEGADVITATFATARGYLRYEPIQKRKRGVNGNWTNKLKGFDLYIHLVDLTNILVTDYIQYAHMVNAITAMIGHDITISVKPRLDPDITPLQFNCFLDDSFKPKDMHKLKIGQITELQFLCAAMQDSIPAIFSDTDIEKYADDAGEEYVDDTGEIYDDGYAI